MEQNKNRLRIGNSPRSVRAEARTWSGYAKKTVAVQPKISEMVTLKSSSQAAKRLFLYSTPPVPHLTRTTTVKPRINYAGNFDLIAPAKPKPQKPREQIQGLRTLVLEPTHKSIEHIVIKKSLKKRRRIGKPDLLMSMAVMLFMLGVGVSLTAWRTNSTVTAQLGNIKTTSAQVLGDTDETTADIPDETPPTISDYSAYRVAPDAPKYIRITSIGVDARIKGLGIKKDNELAAPKNIFDVGWYDQSSKPGQAGAILLDGHVSGPTQNGVFYNLKKLTPGAVIEVERGDGQKFQYKVVKSQKYDSDNVDMAAALTPVIPGSNGLNLITCAGKFNAEANNYDQRLIVFTVQI